MTPEDIQMIRHVLPEMSTFPYYADRESAWALASQMAGDEKLSSLRGSARGPLVARPVIRPLAAASGDGVLRHLDVLALAHADRANGWRLSKAARLALSAVYGQIWHDFQLSYTSWGQGKDWQWNQLSRKGGNLVLQLGFPSDHARLMGQFAGPFARKDLEFHGHPVRRDGVPTLAWVRIDLDLATGVALIEEVQSDWLRFLKEEVADLPPRTRDLRLAQSYEANLKAAYGKIWPRAALLAALTVLRDEFACREVWMHQPETGAALKHIRWSLPPRSLYAALPKSFGFHPTRDAPWFLERPCRKLLRGLRKADRPLFWRLQF